VDIVGKGQGRKTLLFLKKKKQKDFCSGAASPFGVSCGFGLLFNRLGTSRAALIKVFLLLFLQKKKNLVLF
jgi:hypothetical protein